MSSLIIGQNGTCKTSIVFRYCQLIAEQNPNQPAIYISANRLNKLPLIIQNLEPVSKETCKRIRLVYPEFLEDLIEYLAAFFTLNQMPCAFVVDDLNLILKRRKTNQLLRQTYDQTISRVFALLTDNVGHCKLISNKPCRLLVATSFDCLEEAVLFKSVGEHFFDQVFTIKPFNLSIPTCTGIQVISNDDLYKLILSVQNEEITLYQILRRKNN